MTMLPRILAAALAALLFMGSGASAEPLKIRVAWVVAPGSLVPLLFNDDYRDPAIVTHYGKSYTVETQFFRGSTPQITALAADRIDLIQPAFSSFAFAIENARLEDIRVVTDLFLDGHGDYLSQAYMVRGDSPIRTVEDLKGKTIGVNAFGGALDIAMQAMLKKHGLVKGQDYNDVEVTFASIVPALAEKKVDMIGMGMPWMDELREKVGARTIFTMKDAIGESQQIMLAGRKPYLDANRAALNDFFEDYVRGLHWYFDPANREKAIALIAKFNKRKPEDYASWVLTKKDYYRDPYGFPNLQALQSNIDLQRELGFSKEKIDVARYADLSFVQEAKKRLGGGTPAGWR
jgi:NitT/TauT family transport system substrate-binding protein